MRRAHVISVVSAILLAAGCGLDVIGEGTPDAATGDAGPGAPDSMIAPSSGLHFTFRSDPDPLPTPPDGELAIEITSARFVLADVRAVGDAAPGDDRTRVEMLTLDFTQDELELSLPDAPPGVYSFLIAEVVSYEYGGTVELPAPGGPGGDGDSDSDGDAEFDIEDEPPVPITLNIDLKGQSLEDGILEVPIEADLRKIPRKVEWAGYAGQEEVEIRSSSDGIERLRDELDKVFKLDE